MSDIKSSQGVRLREERLRLGLNQTEFGAIGGVQKRAQIRYESGENIFGSDYIGAIAQSGVDIMYVLTGQRQDDSALSHFSALSTPTNKTMFVSNSWIKEDLGVELGDLQMIDITDDSMAPTIDKGDVVLIENHNLKPIKNGLYALIIGDEILLKRVQILPKGLIELSCDSPDYSSFTIEKDDTDAYTILGAVVWYAHQC